MLSLRLKRSRLRQPHSEFVRIDYSTHLLLANVNPGSFRSIPDGSNLQWFALSLIAVQSTFER